MAAYAAIFFCFLVESILLETLAMSDSLARKGEFPHQVFLTYSRQTYRNCEGTIITLCHVLTAARCCYQDSELLPPEDITVVAGQLNQHTAGNSITRQAERMFVDENFIPTKDSNHLAVIRLEEVLQPTVRVQPIALPRGALLSRSECLTAGWSRTSEDEPRYLRKLMIMGAEVMDAKDCKKDENINVESDELCAVIFNEPEDPCFGNFGGPLVCNGYLTGVIVTERWCTDNEYTIFATVSNSLSWIKKAICEDDQGFADTQGTTTHKTTTEVSSTSKMFTSTETKMTSVVTDDFNYTSTLTTDHFYNATETQGTTKRTTKVVWVRSSSRELINTSFLWFCGLVVYYSLYMFCEQ